jgi:hypothetical protein
MKRARAFAVAVLVAGTLVSAPAPTRADSPYQTAFWSRFQLDIPGLGGILPVSIPPVPNGGLFISGGVVGTLGFGALRYYLEGPVPGTLTLHVETGTAIGATINACGVTADWANGDNQVFKDAPTYDCTDAIAGQADTTGMNVTWELTEAYYRPEVFGSDIALVPGGTTPVQVIFAPAGPDSFVHPPVALSPEEPLEASAPEAEPLADIDLLPGLIDLPVAPPLDLPPAPAPGPSVVAPAVPTSSPAPRPVAAIGVDEDDSAERIIALAALLALIATFWWLAGGPGRAAPARGIGRFSRPRAGSPPRL